MVLDAVLARLESALHLVFHVDALEDLFQDVGNADLLKRAAVQFAIKQPAGGHYFESVVDEVLVLHALADAGAYAVDVALIDAGRDFDGDLLAEQLVKRQERIPVGPHGLKIEAEQL